ncbi:glycosyltransferase, partial [Acinetobacter baumannii]|nr:glycosyltransferase [Acinetobacter baumannii]
NSVIKKKGWNAVNELGQLSRNEVKEVLQRSVAGLVTFLPVPNHIDAQPNKMFEYMSAGIPVIGSNYPLWRSIIEDNGCGICVNPEDPEEIAAAIDKLIVDRALAENMGKNGIRAVNEKYNWSIEEKKLFKLYTELLGS